MLITIFFITSETFTCLTPMNSSVSLHILYIVFTWSEEPTALSGKFLVIAVDMSI